MGGRLDDGRGVAGPNHRPEGPLEIGRLGRRDVGGRPGPVAADLPLDRADEAGPNAGRLEHGDGHRRCRRLPIRPGDADHAEPAARVVVPPGRNHREGGLTPVDHDLGRGSRVVDCVLDHDGRGPRRHGPGDEGVAVDVRPGDGDEDGAGNDLPRVVGDRPHDHVRDRPPDGAQAPTRLEAIDEARERKELVGFGCDERRGEGLAVAIVHGRPPGRRRSSSSRDVRPAAEAAAAAAWRRGSSTCS